MILPSGKIVHIEPMLFQKFRLNITDPRFPQCVEIGF